MGSLATKKILKRKNTVEKSFKDSLSKALVSSTKGTCFGKQGAVVSEIKPIRTSGRSCLIFPISCKT